MTKPLTPGGSSRRRSNSTSGRDATSPPSTDTAAVAAHNVEKAGRLSGRGLPTSAKRRSRGLPLSRPKPTDPSSSNMDTTYVANITTPDSTKPSPSPFHPEDKITSPVFQASSTTLSSPRDGTPNNNMKKPPPPDPAAFAAAGGDDDDDDSSEETTDESPGEEDPAPAPPPLIITKTPKSLVKKLGHPPSSSTQERSIHLSSPQALIATDEKGTDWTVRIILNSQPFVRQEQSRKRSREGGDDAHPTNGSATAAGSKAPQAKSFLGNDGNLFYCHVCRGFGDVVCCDGCPHVYHLKCIPEGDVSRMSLENDDDPWFCPTCLQQDNPKKLLLKQQQQQQGDSSSAKKKSKSSKAKKTMDARLKLASSSPSPLLGTSATTGGSSSAAAAAGMSAERRTVKRRCCECHQSSGPHALEPCEGCGMYLHYPACGCENEGEDDDTDDAPGVSSAPSSSPGTILCSTCRSEMALTQEERDAFEQARKKRKLLHVATAGAGDDDDSKEVDDTEDELDDEEDDDDDDDDDDNKFRSLSMEDDMDGDDDDGSRDDHLSQQDSNEPDEDDFPDDDFPSNHVDENDGPIEPKASTTASSAARAEAKKRRIPTLSSFSKPKMESSSSKKKKSEKKKKKKKKHSTNSSDAEPRASPKSTDVDDVSLYPPLGPPALGGMTKATPAFYFFLGEIRMKIERVLSRKHRYFNRLPKGLERNEIIAKEGALWWVKLRQTEVRRYMNMSMRDFEQRIMEWKEEKNIRDMVMETDRSELAAGDNVSSPDDVLLTYLNHQRLYLGTTVGSKPFKPETGVSHNRVLLELLQDMRFHPVPMFSSNRTDTEYGQMDFSRITIPYFDVHGPVATSVGDECLGCARGWTHHCNVLKRRVGAVEHRARLQPPLSSLMATRVGLGLRPRPMPTVPQEETEQNSKKVEPFTEREMPESNESRNLPIVPWDSLNDPGSRADDIVQFIEEAVSMKVPEPPRPSYPGKLTGDPSKKSMFSRVSLPTHGKKRGIELLTLDTQTTDRNPVVNKCGRCRTVIQTDTGCIQCRRAQLVINMSKQPSQTPSSSGRKSPASKSTDGKETGPKQLKVQTFMLGRVTMKEGSGEVQSDGDQAVASGILKERWTPYAIIPPQTLLAPTPRPNVRRSRSEDSGESEAKDEEVDADEDSETADTTNSDMLIEEVIENGEEEKTVEDADARSSKRIRSVRVAAASNTGPPEIMDDADRQKLAEKQKIDSSELHKKTLSVACCGILLALMRRDPLLLFAAPVAAEGYSTIVKSPIDFGKIRSNVLAGKYPTLGAFLSDTRLLCTNALAYNPPGSIYWKTAKELYDVLAVMQKRASNWMGAIKDAHSDSWRRASRARLVSKDTDDESDESLMDDLFDQLRLKWPESVDMLENSDWLRKCITADFMRTKENETAYYGSLAVRRAAAAAEASLAPYPDTGGVYSTISRRTHVEDENLRGLISDRVAELTDPVELKDLPTWREESIIRVMRRAQSRRLEGRIGSVNGCARCDGMRVDQELKMAMTAETVRWGRSRRKGDEIPRLSPSRIELSTGLSSEKTRKSIESQRAERASKKSDAKAKDTYDEVIDVAVSVRGSRIHGWGLIADQAFKKGDVVAEYVGEYVSLAVTEAREKIYQEHRIQDYQFRLDDSLVIDATMRGGHGRYINHNCNPNCIAKTIPGAPPSVHLKRVIIIAQRDIKPREELTYDYQFPLELDLEARIPCNCQSEHCRGFMNWDLPEKGSNNRVLRSHKRGANMRDRIRRLGRPLKSEK
jgi:hypothetical protein